MADTGLHCQFFFYLRFLITLCNLQVFFDPVDSRLSCLRTTTTDNDGRKVMRIPHIALWVTWAETGRVIITLIGLTLPHVSDSPKPGNIFLLMHAGSVVCVCVWLFLNDLTREILLVGCSFYYIVRMLDYHCINVFFLHMFLFLFNMLILFSLFPKHLRWLGCYEAEISLEIGAHGDV